MRQRVVVKVLAAHGDTMVVRIPDIDPKPISLPVRVVQGIAIHTGSEFSATVEAGARTVRELMLDDVEAAAPTDRKVLSAILHCPWCGTRHVDTAEWVARAHHTHLCAGCGKSWRVEPYAVGVPPEQVAPPPSDVVTEVTAALVNASDAWGSDRDCAMSVIDATLDALLNPGEVDIVEHAAVHALPGSDCTGTVHEAMTNLENRARASRRSRILVIVGRLANWLSQVEPTRGA